MRILALAPNIVGGLEGEECGREVGFDKGHRASVLEQPHHGAIFGMWFVDVPRISYRAVIALDLYRVLQRDWNAREWALEIALLLCPTFTFGEQDLRHAVGLFLCLRCDFAVCADDVNGVGDLVVDILNKLLDRLLKDGAFLR